MDLIVLLLIANGYDFHVERLHKFPRIVHAEGFDDLAHATLRAKLDFLERNGMKRTASLIDRQLRNDIAHLDFEIDEEGKIKTRHCKDLNIYEKIRMFTKKPMVIMLILTEAKLES